jgi:hypothetical protein
MLDGSQASQNRKLSCNPGACRGLIPAALAHAKAAYPIGVGTDVLRLVARRRLGLDPPHGEQ